MSLRQTTRSSDLRNSQKRLSPLPDEFLLENIADLSREHVIPSGLGGRMETLTCERRCNNTHGSRLDSHLVNAMRAMDAVDELEPIAITLGSAKGKDYRGIDPWRWDEPEAQHDSHNWQGTQYGRHEHWRGQLADGFSFNLHMTFPYIPERFFRAARAGFFAVFKAEGCGYALSDGASRVRSMLEPRMPVLKKVVMEAFPERVAG